jgi:hypothetical protein
MQAEKSRRSRPGGSYAVRRLRKML